ncbi:Translation elongation factor, selenocysteine-specific [Sulfitobacter noctilucae]|uniref:selenocysteine-specific translation elongation factor n=1 Tax=Sulfitobacter noctilucae TaxID=1342302 RepID=UPI000468B731|nr:selenocysteine-specific translation elongation factor [Sulfitobacter noctilucae]KIN65656.1 Translation elongation factor, selenocysteine-specific [Sulfitobacter noctilucae]
MTTCCTVVIGHVDHGKTALVRALTGADTDQLAEEKARGLSIVPGFAHRTYASGTLDFIDAPGHADFVQAMIRAATGARAALLVISATEGIAEQTREHLSIAALLAITTGVIAVTKSDLLDSADQAPCLDALRSQLAETGFASSPMVLCSAQSGDGIDQLHAALETLIQTAPQTGPQHSFLPIDRAFSMSGLGTIVTGTLQGAAISIDDAMQLHPSGKATSVRGLQSRGTLRQRIEPGERIAANLRGVAVTEIASGAVLCSPTHFAPSRCVDITLTLLPGVTVKHMQNLRAHIGTTSEVATLRLFGGGKANSEQGVLAQLRFGKPVAAFAGQRAILRQLSPAKTLGGVTVLDPLAKPTVAGDKDRQRVLNGALQGDLDQIALALCEANDGVADRDDIARLSRLTEGDLGKKLKQDFQELSPTLIAPRSRIALTETALLAGLKAHHDAHPLRSAAPASALNLPATAAELIAFVKADLNKRGVIRLADNAAALVDHDPLANLDANGHDRLIQIESAYQQAGLQPITPESIIQDQLDRDIFDLLTDLDRLVPLRNVALGQTLIFHTDALTEAAEILRQGFPTDDPFTTSQARTTLSTSRRIIVPVLEYFDAQGWTGRNGNTRHFDR